MTSNKRRKIGLPGGRKFVTKPKGWDLQWSRAGSSRYNVSIKTCFMSMKETFLLVDCSILLARKIFNEKVLSTGTIKVYLFSSILIILCYRIVSNMKWSFVLKVINAFNFICHQWITSNQNRRQWFKKKKKKKRH